MPGYDEDLDATDCPWGDPNKPPDLEKARQMIKEAGAAGTEVTVWGNDDDPTDKVTEAYADMLNKIGLKAKPKIVDGGVYFQTIGNAEDEAPQTGFANWFQDFPHPKNFLFLVDGASIQPTNNQNFGNVDDPEITKGIAELNKEPEITRGRDKWKELNKKLVERAWIVPYGHRKLSTFLSERMDFDNCSLFHPVYTTTTRAGASSSQLDRYPTGEGAFPRPPRSGSVCREGELRVELEWPLSPQPNRPFRGRLPGRPRPRRNASTGSDRGSSAFGGCGATRPRSSSAPSSSCSSWRAWRPRVGRPRRPDRRDTNHLTDTITVDGKSKNVVGLDGVPIGPQWFKADGKFFLGADRNGRDVMVRLLYGGRNSLLIGFSAALITMSSRSSSA